MFPERVKNVTLDKSKITYYIQPEYKNTPCEELPIDSELYLVEDLGLDCSIRSNQYLPDYVIQGYFKIDKNLRYPVFIRNQNGPHLLYVTGIPKDIIEPERNKFRFKDSIWLSYWEDKYIGYLFQVISRESALTNLINFTTI